MSSKKSRDISKTSDNTSIYKIHVQKLLNCAEDDMKADFSKVFWMGECRAILDGLDS